MGPFERILAQRFAAHFLYGMAKGLVERLAEATGEDREQVIKDALR